MAQRFREAGNVKLVITDAEGDSSRQIAQVETSIRERPDLLIVAPNERAALTSVMGDAVAEKLRVICLERDVLRPYYSTYVHSDNVAIGRMAGSFIRDYLMSKYKRSRGNVVEIRGLLGTEGEISRHNGFNQILRPFPDIKIVANPVADWIQSRAKDRMTEVLRAQSAIDVVYAHNDPMAVGAYLAAKELDREKQMIFVGVDGLGGPAGGIKKVMDGILAATFVYPLCVNQAVDVSLQMLRDKSFVPRKEYVIPPEMVNASNAAALYRTLTIQ